jgi:hypothetical protein
MAVSEKTDLLPSWNDGAISRSYLPRKTPNLDINRITAQKPACPSEKSENK